jgi:ABC-type branched-subunit amino acid transport system ATPase component
VVAWLQRSSPATLRVQGLSIRFGGNLAVDGVSFDIRGGEVTSLIGPRRGGQRQHC